MLIAVADSVMVVLAPVLWAAAAAAGSPQCATVRDKVLGALRAQRVGRSASAVP